MQIFHLIVAITRQDTIDAQIFVSQLYKFENCIFSLLKMYLMTLISLLLIDCKTCFVLKASHSLNFSSSFPENVFLLSKQRLWTRRLTTFCLFVSVGAVTSICFIFQLCIWFCIYIWLQFIRCGLLEQSFELLYLVFICLYKTC